MKPRKITLSILALVSIALAEDIIIDLETRLYQSISDHNVEPTITLNELKKFSEI